MLNKMPNDIVLKITSHLSSSQDLIALENASKGTKNMIQRFGIESSWYHLVKRSTRLDVMRALPRPEDANYKNVASALYRKRLIGNQLREIHIKDHASLRLEKMAMEQIRSINVGIYNLNLMHAVGAPSMDPIELLELPIVSFTPVAEKMKRLHKRGFTLSAPSFKGP